MNTGGILWNKDNAQSDNFTMDPMLYEANRAILERFAERALYQHGCLSERLIQRTLDGVEPEKTYTHVVYEADGKSLVMFANEGELNTLVNILMEAVGKTRMASMRRKLDDEDNPLEVIAGKEVAKWNEHWPLTK